MGHSLPTQRLEEAIVTLQSILSMIRKIRTQHMQGQRLRTPILPTGSATLDLLCQIMSTHTSSQQGRPLGHDPEGGTHSLPMGKTSSTNLKHKLITRKMVEVSPGPIFNSSKFYPQVGPHLEYPNITLEKNPR
jgi:hypothetical protein